MHIKYVLQLSELSSVDIIAEYEGSGNLKLFQFSFILSFINYNRIWWKATLQTIKKGQYDSYSIYWLVIAFNFKKKPDHVVLPA